MSFSSNEKRPLLDETPKLKETRRQPHRIFRNAVVLNVSSLLTFSSYLGLTSIQSSLLSDQGLGVTSLAVMTVFVLFGSMLSGVIMRVAGCKWSLIWGMVGMATMPLSYFYPTWGTTIPGAILGGLGCGLSSVAQRVYTSQLGHCCADTKHALKTGNVNMDVNSKMAVTNMIGADRYDVIQMGINKNDVTTKPTTENDITVTEVKKKAATNMAATETENVSSRDTQRARYQGRLFIFYIACYKAGYIVGNLMSSLFLGMDDGNNRNTTSSSVLLWTNRSLGVPPQCGAAYCNEDLQSDFFDVPETDRGRIYGFLGFCLGVMLVGIALVYFLLDNFFDDDGGTSDGDRPARFSTSSLALVWKIFRSTLAMHSNTRLLLLLPYVSAMLACDAFWTADFTKAFITCPLGMEFIGYVIMWVGVSAIIAAFAFGWMSSDNLRRVPLVVAPLVQIALSIELLYWEPDQDSFVALCAYTAAWSLCAGCRHVLLPALVGVIFQNQLELAFSNIQMWSAVGSTAMMLLSNWLCTYVKLYIIIAFLATAIVTYVTLEVLLVVDRRRADRSNNVSS